MKILKYKKYDLVLSKLLVLYKNLKYIHVHVGTLVLKMYCVCARDVGVCFHEEE